jgi:hypothetical protein
MNKRDYMTTIGFVLFLLGFLSMIFKLVGMRFTFLSFLDILGAGATTLIFVLMMVLGLILMYVSKSNKNYK